MDGSIGNVRKLCRQLEKGRRGLNFQNSKCFKVQNKGIPRNFVHIWVDVGGVGERLGSIHLQRSKFLHFLGPPTPIPLGSKISIQISFTLYGA